MHVNIVPFMTQAVSLCATFARNGSVMDVGTHQALTLSTILSEQSIR